MKERYEADPENNKDEVVEMYGEDRPEEVMRRRIKLL